MMKGLNLGQLASKLKFVADNRKDYVAAPNKITMQVDEAEGGRLRPVLELYGVDARFPILDLTHNQIGAFTKVPAQYYDRMLAADPGLLALNVNAWLREEAKNRDEAKKRMVRTLGGSARAFLSNSYQRIENDQIAEVALPILSEIPRVQIVSCEVTEKRMYIQAVSPTVQGEVKRGDVVQAGVIIQNSEVGCGAVSVTSMIWRLACLNGLKTQDRFRAYHVGRRLEDNEELWSDEAKQADDRAVLLKVRDMVRAAVDDKRFRAHVDRMREMTEIKVEGNPTDAVEVLCSKVGVSEDERGGILKALIEGADLSAWGLINAVTAQAHEAKNYDRAVEFEEAGGALLSMGKGDWAQVLSAGKK